MINIETILRTCGLMILYRAIREKDRRRDKTAYKMDLENVWSDPNLLGTRDRSNESGSDFPF